MTKYLDHHHVYSYVVASKNFFSSYPATTQDTQRQLTRTIKVIRLVTVFAGDLKAT
jgi:hypothetical protein